MKHAYSRSLKNGLDLLLLLLAAFLGMALFGSEIHAQTIAASSFPHHVLNHSRMIRFATERFVPQGRFDIEIFRDGRWLDVAPVEGDKHYRLQTIRLPDVAEAGGLRVRIRQSGGGAAHLDSIALNGKPPARAVGIALHKVLRRDFDVADVHEKTFEVSFDPDRSAAGHPSALQFIARIEPKIISETPFQYPLGNMFKPIGRNSDFYSYALGSNPGRLAIDGEIGDERLGAPFLDAYYPVGSGHPQKPTYGWVRDDGSHLYVAFDVIGDNTRDGGKDYTKVYVKTPSGVKMFKVSRDETRWGRPGFTTTGRGPYQHKVYEFAIPFSQLGLKEGDRESAPLGLAFAVYGTFSAGDSEPSMAYSSSCNRFMTGYVHKISAGSSGEPEIESNFYETDGTLAFGSVALTNTVAEVFKSKPAVAYDPVNRRFLVVWEDERNSGVSSTDILGQLVAEDGTLIGTNFAVSEAALVQQNPAVAFDAVNQRFLVIWTDSREGTSRLYGQLVAPNGDLLTSPGLAVTTDATVNFAVNASALGQLHPALAYDAVNQRYLVVYTVAPTFDEDIYGRLVNPNGSAAGAEFRISDGGASNFEDTPQVAFDPGNQRFLVVWRDENPGPLDIFGQLVNASGVLFDQNNNNSGIGAPGDDQITIIANADIQTEPAVAFDPIGGEYLVVWEDWGNLTTGIDVIGQKITTAGVLSGGVVSIAETTDTEAKPSVAANVVGGGFLAGYENTTVSPNEVRVTAAFVAPFTSRGPPVVLPGWARVVFMGGLCLLLLVLLDVLRRNRPRPAFSTPLTVVAVALMGAGFIVACGGGGGGGGVPPPDKKSPQQFVFVANNGDQTVGSYLINGATGSLSPIETLSNLGAKDVVMHPAGGFLYVAGFSTNNVTVYAIDPFTGVATETPNSPFSASGNPWAVTIDPTGKFLYTANINGDSISAYTIDAVTGDLTQLAASPYATGVNTEPHDVGVDPGGKYLYVAKSFTGQISVYAINPATGELTETVNSPFAAGTNPRSLVIVPCGHILYAVDDATNNVLAYGRDVISGDLAPLPTATFAAGSSPWWVAVEPGGRHLYVANFGVATGNISAYAIASDGILTEITNSPFAAGSQVRSVAVDSSGRYVYVANQGGGVSAYSRDDASGDLTELADSPFTTGTSPRSVTISDAPN